MRVAKTDTTEGLPAGLAGSIVGTFRSREMVAEAVAGGLFAPLPLG